MIDYQNMFRPVNGFPWYLVCREGYLINTDSGNVIFGGRKKSGYVEVTLLDENGSPKTRLLHRLVAEAFCEKHSDTDEVNHKDGNKENNCADNLEWISHAENLKHAFITGLRCDDVSPRRVVGTNLDTGEKMEFPSIYSASRFLGISQGNICMCCKKIRPYAGGYLWEYVE